MNASFYQQAESANSKSALSNFVYDSRNPKYLQEVFVKKPDLRSSKHARLAMVFMAHCQ